MAQGDDEHIIEAIGRSRIVIKNGRVVEVGEALHQRLSSCKTIRIPDSRNYKRCHQDEH